MTTSTTTNKQLSLITPGTEVGTWGPYINSTTAILDKALGSTLTVAMATTNVTLSSTDTENQRIRITGTLSANLNLIFPSGVGGAWIMTNATSNSGGPWTITATTGSGTTVVLVQGYSAMIYSDGTNIALADDRGPPVNPIPSGAIILWSGSVASIPTGWLLCNGSSGTPDLRDRFVVGAGNSYNVAATGGSADAVIVSHTHAASVNDPGHTHPLTVPVNTNGFGGTNSGYRAIWEQTQTGATTSATTGISVTNVATGVSATNANLPPYYALAYIMKS